MKPPRHASTISPVCARAPWLALTVVLGSASAVLAQSPDAEAPAESPADRKPPPKEGREPFLKRDGQVADNQQLGGEPSLTEAEEERDRRSKGTLELAKEMELDTTAEPPDPGDALEAEPSTTAAPETELDVPGDRSLPTRLGPVRIAVGKGNDWVGIGLATQMEFEYAQEFPTGGFPKESEEFLEFRRIRLTLSSSFIDGRIQSRFQINLTPSAFDLIDLWFAFTRFKFATFRVGQFKIPYDRYRAQSFAALSLIDWAPTTRMFGSERQIGGEVLAEGGILDLEYAFGIFSGVNARAAHGVGITEVYGERPQNPSNLGSGSVVNEFHPEVVARVARNFRDIDTASNSDTLRTDYLRHSLGGGIAFDARPDATEDLALRLSLEWLGKFRGAYFNVVNYIAWFQPWRGGKILFGPIGSMAETGYRFTSIWELALRYSVIYLTPQLRSDARSYGQAQIAGADPADLVQAELQYGRNGDRTTNNELALAGTARIIGDSLKVGSEVAWQQQLWNTGRRNGFRFNLQLQLVF